MSKLTLTTEGDTHVIVTRRFAASPEAVYRAHTEPELIQKWLLGPGWLDHAGLHQRGAAGRQDPLRMDATARAAASISPASSSSSKPFSRIVHVERMHLPDPTPDNHVETTFVPDGKGTLMTMRMTLPDAETRAAMLASGMEHGMEASYVRLDSMS